MYNQLTKSDIQKMKDMFYSIFSSHKAKKVSHPEAVEKRRKVDKRINSN